MIISRVYLSGKVTDNVLTIQTNCYSSFLSNFIQKCWQSNNTADRVLLASITIKNYQSDLLIGNQTVTHKSNWSKVTHAKNSKASKISSTKLEFKMEKRARFNLLKDVRRKNIKKLIILNSQFFIFNFECSPT